MVGIPTLPRRLFHPVFVDRVPVIERSGLAPELGELRDCLALTGSTCGLPKRSEPLGSVMTNG